MTKRKLKVFLSHAPGDLSAARELYGQLAAEGWLDVWFGEERLGPGMDRQLEIEHAIGKTDSAIICISKDATSQSGSFHRELRLILDAAQNMPEGVIFMIPLKLEDCEPPHVLRYLHFASYFGQERQRVYESVLGSLRTRASVLGIGTATKSAHVSPRLLIKTNNLAVATQDAKLPTVDIRDNAKGNIVIDGSGNEITQNITIHEATNLLQAKSSINTDKITFIPREDTTAVKQDDTGHYAYIEIFNQENYDLRECYVTLNVLYIDFDGWLNMLQRINPNISHLTWPTFRSDQEKVIRRNKSVRINIAKTIPANISFTLEDGDHSGFGNFGRNDYYIEIELNGILNSNPIEALIFKGFLHDKSTLESVPGKPPRVFRRLYIEGGELDQTKLDN